MLSYVGWYRWITIYLFYLALQHSDSLVVFRHEWVRTELPYVYLDLYIPVIVTHTLSCSIIGVGFQQIFDLAINRRPFRFEKIGLYFQFVAIYIYIIINFSQRHGLHKRLGLQTCSPEYKHTYIYNVATLQHTYTNTRR